MENHHGRRAECGNGVLNIGRRGFFFSRKARGIPRPRGKVWFCYAKVPLILISTIASGRGTRSAITKISFMF